MLKYDEWVVPGEVEYARGKDAEIEEQLQRYHKKYTGEAAGDRDFSMDIQLKDAASKTEKPIPMNIYAYYCLPD